MAQITASDGCRVHYDVRGSGAPLVLIPGLGGDGRFWEPVAKLLESRFQLIIADHRGAGRSDRPEGAYEIRQIAGDILRIMDAEGCSRANLVGHSTGGAVAQSLALDTPERMGRIVISGSWPAPDARFRMLFDVRLALLEMGRPDLYQALTHVLGHDAGWIAGHGEELRAAVARAGETLAPLSVTAARIRMLLTHDRSAELGRIAAPTLVIGARDDEMIPFEHSERLAILIPGARLVALEGGHFYPRTRPEAFARCVEEFLA